MKKIAIINAVPYGSTGKIVKGIAKVNQEAGNEVLMYFSWTKTLRKSDGKIIVGSFWGKATHMFLSKVTGYNGCFGLLDTLRLINILKSYQPDIINLHILHSWCVNLPLLFRYIKRSGCQVVWTMHDCWGFTGQCPHFTMNNCHKWKNGCYSCAQYKCYPSSLIDNTKRMWRLKKKWFCDIPNMTIVTPSHWLSNLLKESFLQNYKVKVIYNGIDLEIFKPMKIDIREKYLIEKDKYIVLGVAHDWGIRKGLDVFIELSDSLDERFQIVLVGTNDEIDKILPPNIVSIHKTGNQEELAMIYSMADVFANPTREEVLGLVNIEALACGVPIVTFDTGGCVECFDESCGISVECNDVKKMAKEIEKVCVNKVFNKVDCITKAREFDMKIKFDEYVQLFNELK